MGQGPPGRLTARRLAATAAAVAAVAVLAAPGAGAQQPKPPAVAVTIDAPQQDMTVGADAKAAGSVHATSSTGIFSATVTWVKGGLSWHKPGTPPPLPKALAICGPAPDTDATAPAAACQGGSDVAFSNAETPQPAFNGPYTLTVTAEAREGNQTGDGAQTRDYGIAIPPPPPGNVTATVNKDRTVTLAWDRNTVNPDVFTYYVWRKGPGDKDFQAAFQSLQASKGDRLTAVDQGTAAAGGNYIYQIETRRNGATGDNTSFAGTRSPATKPVAVPNPPPGTPPPTQPPPSGKGAPPPVVKTTPVKTTRVPIASGSSSPPTTEQVTPDPGFVRGLPFANRGTTPGDDTGDNPSVGLNRTTGKSSSNNRDVLIPAAFGAILFVGAFQLRWFMRQIERPPGTPLT